MSATSIETPTPSQRVCLSIAGSDSGGGAGIQADLEAFRAFDCFGTTAITAITAQNPGGVRAIHPVPADVVAAQIEAVLEAFSVGAVKTGMLFSADIIAAVAGALGRAQQSVQVVVDPVMIATSGVSLLQDDAIRALHEHLLPLASLITPNLPEAEIIVGDSLPTDDSVIAAAGELVIRLGVSVLIKGGHREGGHACDVLATPGQIYLLDAPRLAAACTHGTGCALSAAIAAGLAHGKSMLDAVADAKAYVFHAIANCHQVGPATHALRPDPAWSRDTIEITHL